jgi:uncharacterized membrane protein YdjX (TVP38/TMEM64 family)
VRASEPAAEPPGSPRPPALRRALLRFTALLLLLALGWLLYRFTPLSEWLGGEEVAELMDRLAGNPWSPFLLLALWLVLSPLGVPVSPLVLAGGALYGVRLGWLYNVVGAMLGAAATYYLAGRLGRELVVHLIGRRREQQAEALVARHGFGAVMRSRFLPIPYAVVNYGAALAGLPFRSFALATLIGMAPTLLVYTWLGSALVRAATGERAGLLAKVALAMGAILLLSFTPQLLRRLRGRAG